MILYFSLQLSFQVRKLLNESKIFLGMNTTPKKIHKAPPSYWIPIINRENETGMFNDHFMTSSVWDVRLRDRNQTLPFFLHKITKEQQIPDL